MKCVIILAADPIFCVEAVSLLPLLADNDPEKVKYDIVAFMEVNS